MKKLLGILVLGLLLSENAYAGLFNEPVLNCKVDGVYITFDLNKWEKVEGEVTHSGKFLLTKTKEEYNLLEVIYTEKNISYTIWWVIDRYSGVINGSRSKKTSDSSPKKLKDTLTYVAHYNGICKKT